MHFSIGFVAVPRPLRAYVPVSVTVHQVQAARVVANQVQAAMAEYPQIDEGDGV